MIDTGIKGASDDDGSMIALLHGLRTVAIDGEPEGAGLTVVSGAVHATYTYNHLCTAILLSVECIVCSCHPCIHYRANINGILILNLM